LTSRVDAALSTTQRFTKEQLEHIDNRLEFIDKQIATLVIGYAEQAVFIESLMAEIEYETEEKQNRFKEHVAKLRNDMMEVLEFTENVLENGDTIAGGTMEDMATPNSVLHSGE
jgi:predicted transcriptional regulator